MAYDFDNRARGAERRYPNGEKMPDEEGPVTEEETPEDIPFTGGKGRFIPAIALVAVGAIFLLANMGIIHFHDIWRYWPLALIVSGVFKFSSRERNAKSSAMVMLIVGAIFLVTNLGLFEINFRFLWPLGLVALGLFLFSRSWRGAPFGGCSSRSRRVGARGRGPQVERPFGAGPYSDSPMASSSFADADERLENWALFGGVNRIITSQNFQGGELFAVFGGIEVDLRRANIINTGRPVVIEANAAFGGISIKVPDTWRIAVRGVGIFGGYQDEAIKIRQPDPSAPLLVITGYAAFGGVVIE